MRRHVHPDVSRLAEAIATLFHPHVEVALHDLTSGRIVQLWNPFPGRRPGDRSPLAPELNPRTAGTRVIGPYPLVDAAGRRLTSISVPVEDGAGLLCVNFDRTAIDGALAVLASLAPAHLEPATDPAGGDWPARISAAITTWCAARNLTPRHLTKDARRQVVQQLDAEGLFETRNAVEHVAAALGVSRATVYNLRQRAGSTPTPCRTTTARS